MIDDPKNQTNQIRQPNLLISVGDLSADRHTAQLIAQLKKLRPDVNIWGLGSENMRKQGAELLFDCKDFSSIGIFGNIKLIPFLFKIRQTLLAQIKVRQPKAILLVDFSGLNLSLAQVVKKKFSQLPIYYFISPQVWGSRPGRIDVIAKTISKIFVIFPFERQIYAKRGVPVQFVGHPLVKNLPDKESLMSREEFCSKYNLKPDKPIIAVFSGSRKNEIKTLFPVLLQAIEWLGRIRPELQFALSQVNEETGQVLTQRLAKNKLAQSKSRIISSSDNYSLMSICNLVWAKSGTTTLEATLFGKPMLIFYRGDWLSYLVFLALKKVQRVGWPNLLAGKALVPELIQLDCRAERLVKYTLDLLDVPKLHEEIAQELLVLKDQLGEGDYAYDCAVEIAKTI